MTRSAPLVTTSPRGLDYDSFPMRLWTKGKRLGVWDPQDIDFTQDREDWVALDDKEREVLLHLSSLFLAGEECVTRDLLPLVGAIAREGRIEEEMYLTSFLFEEAKHVEVFRRFLDEVVGESTDLSRYSSPAYDLIFHDALPTAMDRLWRDSSPVAMAEASVVYNMIVEGVLAETGYYAYQNAITRNGILPGMQKVVRLLNRDESRHIAFGVYLLSRLVAENGKDVWSAIEKRMFSLLQPALAVVGEALSRYEVLPFGLTNEEFIAFATKQFNYRYGRLEKARRQSMGEVTTDCLTHLEDIEDATEDDDDDE